MRRINIYRMVSLFVALIVGVSAFGATLTRVEAAPASAATSVTFKPSADTYINQSLASTNYGTATALHVDNGPINRSYLRFTVSGLPVNGVQSATLRIYANSSSPTGLTAHQLSNNSWTEKGLTYANAPAAGTAISSSKPFASGTWVSLDVSSAVKAMGTYNFVLTTSSSTKVNLAAREAATLAPQLVVIPASGTTVSPTPAPTKSPTPAPTTPPATNGQPTFPIRAAFYYPWFEEGWTQLGIYPYTNYTPTLGYYSSRDQTILKKHIEMMQYGNIDAGIASWWGQGSQTDTKIAGLLTAATGTNFRWALYYENESQGNPSASQIQSDLVYIRDHYAQNPTFLRVNGKFVVFVYSDGADACGMADRWKQANTVGAYIVLKVFPGFANCASQPDSWHQYSPAVAADQQGSMSYAISPGFWLKGNAVRLARDITRWKKNVTDMVASGAKWQLITTFSEWGEGTSVEPATQWASASGYGLYLDALHSNP